MTKLPAPKNGLKAIVPVTAPHIPMGLLVFGAVVLAVAALAALRLEPRVRVFLAGEIATQNVAADQNLLIEDREATIRKREFVAMAQPPVYDFLPMVAGELRSQIDRTLAEVAQAEGEGLERLRWRLAEDFNAEIGKDVILSWRQPEFVAFLHREVLPWLEAAYRQGVAPDAAMLNRAASGVVVRTLPSGMETVRFDVSEFRDVDSLKTDLDAHLKNDLRRTMRLRRAVYVLVTPHLRPNLVENTEMTADRRREAASAVEAVFSHIKRGEVVVRMGERVTPEQQRKLQLLSVHQNQIIDVPRAAGIALIGLMFVVVLQMSMGRQRFDKLADRDWYFLALLIFTFGVLAKVMDAARYSQNHLPLLARGLFSGYLLPIAGASGVMAIFFSKTFCFFGALTLSFFAVNIMGGGLPLFCYYFLGSTLYVFLLKRSEARADVMRATTPLLGVSLALWLAVGLIDFTNVEMLAMGSVLVLANAIFSLLVVMAMSPVMETVFGFTSRFKLMELMNLEQPLLQELMVNAPGTYHHSIIVANMVEAGARVIGANPLLAKVAALYHDVGKLKSPQYFIENQFGKENKHNKLAPTMSALILVSHVKEGIKLAKEHGLGPELTSLIAQHHGKSLITFFYHKAQELAEAKGEDPVSEEDFRYPGPRPQTKEAGLIMLADAIEASSRTLVDPTPARIKGHIQTIMRKIYTEGELDNSELTLKDLSNLAETFQRILTGLFHQRIEYPGTKPKVAAEPRTEPKNEPKAEAKPEKAAESAEKNGHDKAAPRLAAG